jgi:hypothetical protein
MKVFKQNIFNSHKIIQKDLNLPLNSKNLLWIVNLLWFEFKYFESKSKIQQSKTLFSFYLFIWAKIHGSPSPFLLCSHSRPSWPNRPGGLPIFAAHVTHPVWVIFDLQTADAAISQSSSHHLPCVEPPTPPYLLWNWMCTPCRFPSLSVPLDFMKPKQWRSTHTPVLERWNRSPHTCAQDVQITCTTNK